MTTFTNVQTPSINNRMSIHQHKDYRIRGEKIKHKKSQEQRLKRRFKSNFQTRNKTILCDSKTKTQDLRVKT
jgi:hypothetical protein